MPRLVRFSVNVFRYVWNSRLHRVSLVIMAVLAIGRLASEPSVQTRAADESVNPAKDLNEREDRNAPLLKDWNLETPAASWQARDSSGELVFKDRLWLFGGWFDSFSAPPRDVWSSPDGVNWDLVCGEAPWKHSDLAMTVTFRDRMWIMGGWYNGRLAGHSASNEVWSSENGTDWDQVTASADWSPRLAAGLVEFKGRMWLLGGTENYYFGDQASLKNDVWSSEDGKTWQLETGQAPWSARAYHQAVVHRDRIWVLGGGNYVPEYHAKNDVWSSADGVHWVQEMDSAPWSPRLWFSAVEYREKIWVIGGWSNNPAQNRGDVWHSSDGKDWHRVHSNRQWKERHEHSAWVFRDKIWIAAGHAQPLSQEVWSLSLPIQRLNAP